MAHVANRQPQASYSPKCVSFAGTAILKGLRGQGEGPMTGSQHSLRATTPQEVVGGGGSAIEAER